MNENQNPPEQTQKKSGSSSLPLVGGIIGFILGIPISYYFQPGIIRVKLTCGDYVSRLPDMIGNILKQPDDLGIKILLTLVITCIVTAAIGGLIGKAIAK